MKTISYFSIGFNAMPDTRTYPQKARARITGSKIITRLIKHVMGEIEMTATQVRAAGLLLNKVLPDLKSVAMTQETISRPAAKMSDRELQEIIRKGLERERVEALAAEGSAELRH
jgi:hypothetical protein